MVFPPPKRIGSRCLRKRPTRSHRRRQDGPSCPVPGFASNGAPMFRNVVPARDYPTVLVTPVTRARRSDSRWARRSTRQVGVNLVRSAVREHRESESASPRIRSTSRRPVALSRGPRARARTRSGRVRRTAGDFGPTWSTATARSANPQEGGGSPSRTRTYDKPVNSRLLYQLSYRGTRAPKGSAGRGPVKRPRGVDRHGFERARRGSGAPGRGGRRTTRSS